MALGILAPELIAMKALAQRFRVQHPQNVIVNYPNYSPASKMRLTNRRSQSIQVPPMHSLNGWGGIQSMSSAMENPPCHPQCSD
jgi:hypothetical protein